MRFHPEIRSHDELLYQPKLHALFFRTSFKNYHRLHSFILPKWAIQWSLETELKKNQLERQECCLHRMVENDPRKWEKGNSSRNTMNFLESMLVFEGGTWTTPKKNLPSFLLVKPRKLHISGVCVTQLSSSFECSSLLFVTSPNKLNFTPRIFLASFSKRTTPKPSL